MFVGQICVREVDTADPGEPVQAAAARMNDRNVGSLVVLNDLREPIGIVTDRDLTLSVLARARDPYATKVRDVMTVFPRTVCQDDTIEDALCAMRSGPFRRLPVVDARGKLVGLVTLDDILDLLAEEFGQISRLIRCESPAALATGAGRE